MSKKRTRLEIIRDILEAIKNKNGKIKPTHILYKSNLSHQMMEEYLFELINKGFIVETRDRNRKTYSITEKGQNYLSQYASIIEFTNAFGLN